jgi:hypothetical protein
VPTAGDNQRRADSQPRRCVAEGPRSTPRTSDAAKGYNGRQPVNATRRRAAKPKIYDPPNEAFRSRECRQTWQKRPGSPYDPKSENGATESLSVAELGEVENLGSPHPTRKPKVGSTSNRCQTKGSGHDSQLPKFEADRTDGFRDTGVRKCTPNSNRPISTTAIGRYPGNPDAVTTSRLRNSETVGDGRSARIEHL